MIISLATRHFERHWYAAIITPFTPPIRHYADTLMDFLFSPLRAAAISPLIARLLIFIFHISFSCRRYFLCHFCLYFARCHSW
jgi:hypothetical protein